jgi:hypothetical protein
MKKGFELLVNGLLKEELVLLFGDNSFIKINGPIKYSTNAKLFVISCTLYSSEVELCEESYPHGLQYIIDEAWKYMGIDSDITVVTSLDILETNLTIEK